MADSDSAIAERLYVQGLTSSSASADWREAIRLSRQLVSACLRATRHLTDIPAALAIDGSHARVLRHLAGPPISQDQFELLCPAYGKGFEGPRRYFSESAARVVGDTLYQIRDRKLTRWLDRDRAPTRQEVRNVIHSVAPLLSQQTVATVRRLRLSAAQEGAVIALLAEGGWRRIVGGTVDQSSALPLRHFMHKTRFATRTRAQEVDIACGLGKSVVLAMECKVTNDRTNSVKRVNDILKKATAWQEHWGSFVRTAAMLQGVVAERDVARLDAANVAVFWSHDLATFSHWLAGNISE